MVASALWFPNSGLSTPINPWPGPPGRTPPSGNYWHYLVGYLVPLVGALRRALGPFDEQEARQLILQSSTVAMNGVAAAVLGLTPHKVEFFRIGGAGARRRVPGTPGPASRRARLVHALPAPMRNTAYALRCMAANLRWTAAPRLPGCTYGLLETIPVTNWSDAWWWWDPRHRADPSAFLGDLSCLRGLMALENARTCEARYLRRYLVVQRTQREWDQRSIVNAETLAQGLSNLGVPSVVYEPGAHSVTCQAAAFGNAVGIVGVRGAEFANLVWMTPGSSILILEAPMPHPWRSPHPLMASLLGLHFAIRKTLSQSAHITAADVLSALPQLRQVT